jgi:hypothetical protein
MILNANNKVFKKKNEKVITFLKIPPELNFPPHLRTVCVDNIPAQRGVGETRNRTSPHLCRILFVQPLGFIREVLEFINLPVSDLVCAAAGLYPRGLGLCGR